ncbi:hypothetical protein EJV47_09110 [Hymenobacter gummosus]|uniref:Uncharacterized protein n=1 Tax=Hymenobacter gummosus TaxID=1776032 RepID=A0A431U4U6_9BACT|nr:peptidase inhibitor family I36 protein [Hymenobacter gummosus]RTQ50771.1 hypothetical protein EJV47_09110 [Hymenobacter gummosus]
MSFEQDQLLQAQTAPAPDTTTAAAANPDCWVSFWENDDYKGNTRTFSGAQTINDLAEYTYDGDDQEMDDSINSLKTGPSTWLCVFSQHKCEGEILRVGPNTGIKNLEDYNLPGLGDWQNTIVSFVTYDHQPNFWDATNETAAGQCWVKIYSGTRYTGEAFALRGAGEVVNTGCIDGYRYYNEESGYWYEVYPNSLTTGPTTWVELYEDASYGTLIARFGPNSLIPDLSKYSISQGAVRVSSLKVFEQLPADFTQTEQTPNEVITIQRYQTAQKLGSVLGDVIGMVPEVGGLLTGMLDLLWPSGPSTAEV